MRAVGLDIARFWDAAPPTLSSGIKQRAVIAGGIVNGPKALLFDEVTAPVDPLNRAETMEVVAKLVREDHVAGLW